MSVLAEAMAIQAAAESIKHQQERRKISEWCRLNATTRRALPAIPDDKDPLTLAIGMVHAITSSASDGGGSGGTDSGKVDAGTGANGASGDQAAIVPSPAGSQGTQGAGSQPISQGGAVGSGSGANGGTSVTVTTADSSGDSRRPRNWAIPWIVATASTVLGAGGLGFSIANSLNEKQPEVTINEGDDVNAEYPLRDYIEDEGWHRK